MACTAGGPGMEAFDWGSLRGSPLSLHLPSFIYLFSYSVDLSSLSVGIFGGEGGTTLPFMSGTSRVVYRLILFLATACGA
jgi:hypothetical protein